MIKDCVVTTMDNPNNPFTEFLKWLQFDIEHGYKTIELLDYFSHNSTKLDEEQYSEENNNAIDLLLQMNPFGIHMKVYRNEAETLIPLANLAFEQMNKSTEN